MRELRELKELTELTEDISAPPKVIVEKISETEAKYPYLDFRDILKKVFRKLSYDDMNEDSDEGFFEIEGDLYFVKESGDMFRIDFIRSQTEDLIGESTPGFYDINGELHIMNEVGEMFRLDFSREGET